MKQKLGFSFLFLAYILISSCSDQFSDSSDPKILEEINLVCEGELTRNFDNEWQSTEPEKKVYRFVKTEEGAYLYGFGVVNNPEHFKVNINNETITLLYKSAVDQDGHFHYQSIEINRFTGDVDDRYDIQSFGLSQKFFVGSCKSQDQKF